MAPAGAAKVAAARTGGSWSALDDIENLVVPADLAEALASRPQADRRLPRAGDGASAVGFIDFFGVAVRVPWQARLRRGPHPPDRGGSRPSSVVPCGRDCRGGFPKL